MLLDEIGIERFDVFVVHPDAAERNAPSDGFRFDGAVDAVALLAYRFARNPDKPYPALSQRVARIIGRYDLYDDTIFGNNGTSGTVMAVAKINLYRGGSDAAAREAAEANTGAYEHNIRRFEEGVQLEVRQAWQEASMK